jgi:nitroreductase
LFNLKAITCINLLNQFDMKIKLSFLVIALFAVSKLYGQIPDNCVANVILSGYSERTYTSVPVTDQQLELILNCGIKAPSARNGQPWKFTVIKDEVTMKEIINNVVPGNVLIVVSGTESEGGTTPDFDCGLASESMFLAAHSLGLGARIYGSPAGNINSKKEQFQIPSGYKAVVVLRIGNIDKSVDAVSAATPRKKPEEVINYKK